MEIQGMSFQGASYQKRPEVRLTEEQKTSLQDIISRYDSTHMTDADKTVLRDELKGAGIPKTRETGDILKTAGFELHGVKDGPPMGGPAGGQRPGPPPMPQSSSSSAVDSGTSMLTSLLDQYRTGKITEDDLQTRIEELRQNLTQTVGNMINQYI